VTHQPEVPAGRTSLRYGVDPDDAVRNLALAVVMQWGPAMRVPESERLGGLTADLPIDRAEEFLVQANEAFSIGTGYLWDRSEDAGDKATFAPYDDMAAAVLKIAPWVDEENLSHLYKQACYYTWHG